MRILLIRLDHMGDVVLSVPPVVRSIKDSLPEAEVDVLTTRAGAVILHADPGIARIVSFDPPWSVPRPAGGPSRSIDWMSRVADFSIRNGFRRTTRYDAMFYLSYSPWERILTRYWGSRRIGYSAPYVQAAFKLSNHLLTERIAFDTTRHVTDNSIAMVGDALGIKKGPAVVELKASPPSVARGRELLQELPSGNKPILVVHAATSASTKAWPLENFISAMSVLEVNLGLRAILVGRPQEISFARRWCAVRSCPAPLMVETRTVEDLIGVTANAALFLGNDGGPAHIASGLGIPTVAVFGPTDERVFGPRGRFSVVVRREGICGQRHYPWSGMACGCRTDRECLRLIPVDDVVKAAGEIYERTISPGTNSVSI